MFQAGAARTRITPYWGVELTGWGYYVERRWRRIHDALNATALAVEDVHQGAIILALDLMVIDEAFTSRTRQRISDAIGLAPESILLACSHSHNAPAAGGLRGVGACDPFYEDWASRQAATAAILAWNARTLARLRVGHADVTGLTFNRTRPEGQTDPRWTLARLDRADGSPLAILANFAAHPTVTTELRPWDVSRDVPGLFCDGLEAAFPGALALYLQGACGDVNFRREFTDPARWREPADLLVAYGLEILDRAPVVTDPAVRVARTTAQLPTRRWEIEEIERDRQEAERRLATRDLTGWRETIGRSMTNRPDDMVTRHGGDEWKAVAAMCRFHREWTELMLRDYATRPETLATEIQAIRLGDLAIVAHSAELFTPFALDLRRRAACPELMVASYANGRIGYLPDAHDIAARSYAGIQSPKYCNQFPFTLDSGPAMVEAMLGVLQSCQESRVGSGGAALASVDPPGQTGGKSSPWNACKENDDDA